MEPVTLQRITSRKDVAVLLLHGIIELPYFFNFIIDGLPSDITYIAPTLKGHGLPSRQFGKSSMKVWKKQVDEIIENELKDYKQIVLVGHSLGTLLSIYEGIRIPERISGAVLLNVPLKLHMKMGNFKTYFTVAFTKQENIKDDTIRHAAEICGVQISRNPFTYIYWAKPFASLLFGIREGRKNIKIYKTPSVAFSSKNDELVSPKSLKFLKKNESIKIIELDNSSHYLYSTEGKQLVISSICDMIKKAEEKSSTR